MNAINQRIPPLARNLGILAVLAALITFAGSFGFGVLRLMFLLGRLAFVVVLLVWGTSLWRQNRGTFGLMKRHLRYLLYGSVLLLVAILVSADFWATTSGLAALVFFALVGGLGYLIWRLWMESRRYYY